MRIVPPLQNAHGFVVFDNFESAPRSQLDRSLARQREETEDVLDWNGTSGGTFFQVATDDCEPDDTSPTSARWATWELVPGYWARGIRAFLAGMPERVGLG